MDQSALETGLAQAVASAVDGLVAYDYAAEAITEPCFLVTDVTIEYDQTFGRGLDAVTVKAVVLVSRSDDRAGQKKLQAYLSGSGAASLKAAIEGDSTLGGECHDLRVVRCTGRRFYLFGERNYVGAELEVFIIGPGD
jgi:hypothetical protein